MCLKVSLLLLGLCISVGHARRLHFSAKTDAKVAQLHTKSMVLAEDHQVVSAKCFSHYNPQLKQATAQYQMAYDSCLDAFDYSSKKIVETYSAERMELKYRGYNSCKALTICQQSKNAYLAFECASTTASEDAKVFYEISANGTDLAAKSKADYVTIGTQKDICVNIAERNFVEKTESVYTQLNLCLEGQPIPTTPETTTIKTTAYPTTTPPVTITTKTTAAPTSITQATP